MVAGLRGSDGRWLLDAPAGQAADHASSPPVSWGAGSPLEWDGERIAGVPLLRSAALPARPGLVGAVHELVGRVPLDAVASTPADVAVQQRLPGPPSQRHPTLPDLHHRRNAGVQLLLQV